MLIERIKDQLRKYSTNETDFEYLPEDQVLNATIRHEYDVVFTRKYPFKLLKNPDDHLQKIIQAKKDFQQAHLQAIENYKKALDQIVPEQIDNFRFIGHRIGKCCYSNLGSIKSAYLGLSAVNCNNQWMKVYFKPDDVMWNKTKEELVKHRQNQVTRESRTDIPPNVWLLDTDLEEKAFDYCIRNEREILESLKALPLNKLDLREDANLTVAIMQLDNEQTLRQCLKGDLADPTKILYLVLLHNVYSKKTSGFCKKIDSNEAPRMIYEDKKFYGGSDLDPASIISEDNIPKSISPQTIIKEIPPKDQYLEWIFNYYLKKWSEKCSASTS